MTDPLDPPLARGVDAGIAFAGIVRRLGRAAASKDEWCPPALPELVARIDRALAERQAR